MAGFILAKKSVQSQMFDKDGNRIPTTEVLTTPCHLIDIKLTDVNGYNAVTLAFGITKNVRKSVQGQMKKAGIETALRFIREIRTEDYTNEITNIEENGKKGIQIGETKLFIGDVVSPAVMFKVGDLVDVSGTSKGKGFQGVVKRHGFAGGPKTHGQSDRERSPGSMGQTTTPGRVYRGKRMAGRMGGERVTIQQLEVVGIKDDGITLKGLIPGSRNGLVEIKTHRN